ncbi:putative ribonuclease H-like domain-containing protein, partial [Tanacetum coccineum]
QLSTKDKTGLRYIDQLSESDSEVPTNIFDSRSSNGNDNQTNDRFKKGDGYHAVPPHLIGNYMPPLADLSFARLDDSIYRPIAKKSSASTSQGDASVTQTSNISVEMPKDDNGNPQQALNYKGMFESGCSQAYDKNKALLSDYQDIDGVLLHFGGSSKGGKIKQNVVPSRDLTCLFSKATIDESNLCHRRLGHVNFKTMNKLVKGNLVRGLPSKTFENDHTCVAYQKGKQHKASFKVKPSTKRQGPNWLFDIDSLSNSMNYQPVTAGNQANKNADQQDTNGDTGLKENVDAGHSKEENVSTQLYIVFPLWSSISSSYKSSDDKTRDDSADDAAGNKDLLQEKVNRASSTNSFNTVSTPVNTVSASRTFSPLHDPLLALKYASVSHYQHPLILELEDIAEMQTTGIFGNAYDDDMEHNNSSYADESVGAEANFNNIEPSTVVSPIPTTRIHSIHPKAQIIGDPMSLVQTRSKIKKTLNDESWVEAMQEELLQFKIQKVWTLVDLPNDKKAIGTKWVYRNKKVERGIVVRNKARLVAQGHKQEEGIDYDEMDVKSAFLYSTIKEEIMDFTGGKIDKTLFIKRLKGDILLVQVYVDDIIFGSTKKSLFDDFEQIMHSRFQMSLMGELTFFLGLQVKQKENGIFNSQEKHHFIRDSYEKRLIEMVKIHIDQNVADLLTKAFNVGDEAVHKELGDRMERAATTASSFEAE